MQRWLIGIIGVVFLFIGISFYLSGQDANQQFAGILIRVGFLLATIWLAWPQFESLKNRVSAMFLLGCLTVLLLAAIRPKLFPIALALFVASFFLNAVMRRFATSKKP